MIKYLIFLLIFSCSKKPEKQALEVRPEIAAKAELYKSLHKGWAHDKCDSLGFTSLCKLAGGCVEADIKQAQSEPGRWYRSPEHNCFDLGESRSDISKDMFIMMFPYLWNIGDKIALADIYSYGKKNNWIMGRYDGTVDGFARVYMVPEMSLFLEEMLSKKEFKYSSDVPVNSGFAAHLDVIWFLTKAIVRKEMDAVSYERVRIMVDKQPRNALFQAVYHRFKDGDQSNAINILMDESLFPASKLPSSRERCEKYLWQRDEDNSDWIPCDKEQTHDGVDFLVAAWVAGQI